MPKLSLLPLAALFLSGVSAEALERASSQLLAQAGEEDGRSGSGARDRSPERDPGGDDGAAEERPADGKGADGDRPARAKREAPAADEAPRERPARRDRDTDAAPRGRDASPPDSSNEDSGNEKVPRAKANDDAPPRAKDGPPAKKSPPAAAEPAPEPKAQPKEIEPKAPQPQDAERQPPDEPQGKAGEPPAAAEPSTARDAPQTKKPQPDDAAAPRGTERAPDGDRPRGQDKGAPAPKAEPPPAAPAPAPDTRAAPPPKKGTEPAATPAAPSEVKDLKELKAERKERKEDGGKRVVIEEPDKRVIVKEGNRTIIRADETERFRRLGGQSRRETRNGLEISIAIRPGGIEIFTEMDDRGRPLRRYRRDSSGREVVLFDNRDYYRRHRDGSFIDAIVDLPPPRIGIPRTAYIVDYEEASDSDIYDALIAPPVERLDRAYSLEEVRRSPSLRDRMRRVDLDVINFAFGAWDIAPDQYPALERIANAMNRVVERDPREMFLIEGHTDAVGSDEDNLSLSDRRAETVAIILTEEFGVPPENITTQGYGEQYLKVDTPEPEVQNRRVAVRRITPLISQSE